jgi:hypothetical protein
MVDGIQILIWNRTMKPLAIVLSGVGRGWKGRDGGIDLTNVKYKLIRNYHNKFPLYNEYLVIKINGKNLQIMLWKYIIKSK